MASPSTTSEPAITADAPAAAAPLGRFATWRYVFNTANLPAGMTRPDAISKWLVITRAAVFSMTATSGLIGGLLAVGAARLTGEVSVDWGLLILAVVGLVVAHAANNMITTTSTSRAASTPTTTSGRSTPRTRSCRAG